MPMPSRPTVASPVVGSLIDHSATITTGGTAQAVMAENRGRRYMFIQNVSTGDLWVNFTAAAVTSQPSIKLASGSSLTFVGPFVSGEAVSVIGATTGQGYTAKEG